MKLLWFSHFIPFPPRGGSFQRSYHLMRNVASDFELLLIAFNMQGLPPSLLRDYESELKQFCARIEFWELPVAWRSARWWLRLGASPLFRRPYTCRSFWSSGLAERWQAILRQTDPDLLHFDSIDLALYTPREARARKVLNHHNCESAMAFRRAQNSGNPFEGAFLQDQAHKLAGMEKNFCPLFDVNLAVSHEDAGLLQERSPQAHMHVVENGTDSDYFSATGGEEEADTLVFAGSLRWYPNVSGIEFFMDRIWPLVKARRPKVRLILAGRDPAPSIRRWGQKDSAVSVVPSPEDIRPWVERAAVFICPIVDGGGTRLKILDALAMGKAVVSTTVGCEGLGVQPGKNILVADPPAGFADHILRLLENAELRRKLGAAGRMLIETRYSWKTVAGQLREAYRCALNPEACPLRLAAPANREVEPGSIS